MHEYKVKILKPNNWRRYPVGRLDISVGMPYHEGPKLEAAIGWASQRFSHIIISLADTLQRHNYMAEGMDADAAYNHSFRLGTEWLERNRATLEGATIIRWDQRLRHPLYGQFVSRTMGHLHTMPAFRESLEEEANGYAARKGLQVTQHRVDYLIEEIAVFDMLFRTEPAADVYPGSILPFWEQDIYENRAAFTRIDFTRKNAA